MSDSRCENRDHTLRLSHRGMSFLFSILQKHLTWWANQIIYAPTFHQTSHCSFRGYILGTHSPSKSHSISVLYSNIEQKPKDTYINIDSIRFNLWILATSSYSPDGTERVFGPYTTQYTRLTRRQNRKESGLHSLCAMLGCLSCSRTYKDNLSTVGPRRNQTNNCDLKGEKECTTANSQRLLSSPRETEKHNKATLPP